MVGLNCDVLKTALILTPHRGTPKNPCQSWPDWWRLGTSYDDLFQSCLHFCCLCFPVGQSNVHILCTATVQDHAMSSKKLSTDQFTFTSLTTNCSFCIYSLITRKTCIVNQPHVVMTTFSKVVYISAVCVFQLANPMYIYYVQPLYRIMQCQAKS